MKEKDIYWANLCILNRKEGELMEEAASNWKDASGRSFNITYLGDTEEVKMHQKVEEDIAEGDLGFHLLISSRFDIFCSRRYLLGQQEKLRPISGMLPIRYKVKASGVCDPMGLYHPLVVLPHYIVVNTEVLGDEAPPESLQELLAPRWAGRVAVGNTELPSGQSVLFAMWYLFGERGLETCTRNWRQKSAPSAVRHGLLKGEFPIGLLPGIFAGPGPGDQITVIRPKEGLPLLPSYAAVRDDEDWRDTVSFLKHSSASPDFLNFYRDMAHAVASDPGISMPTIAEEDDKYLFPPWEWILERDIDHFLEMVGRLPTT